MPEPEGQLYLEIPHRTLLHPAVTLWEQRQAPRCWPASRHRSRSEGTIGELAHLLMAADIAAAESGDDNSSGN